MVGKHSLSTVLYCVYNVLFNTNVVRTGLGDIRINVFTPAV